MAQERENFSVVKWICEWCGWRAKRPEWDGPRFDVLSGKHVCPSCTGAHVIVQPVGK
jgi:hypothetical protein